MDKITTKEQFQAMWKESSKVPYGFCWCGCGGKTKIAEKNSKRPTVKGEPNRYLMGHYSPPPRPKNYCYAENCGKRVASYGLCWTHWAQVKRNGKLGNKRENAIGNRMPTAHGYVKVFHPEHPNADTTGYIFEHRLNMAHHLGRPLKSDERVHHKNGNKKDNRIENLELWTLSHPSGSRVEDKIAWAIEFLKTYGYSVNHGL